MRNIKQETDAQILKRRIIGKATRASPVSGVNHEHGTRNEHSYS